MESFIKYLNICSNKKYVNVGLLHSMPDDIIKNIHSYLTETYMINFYKKKKIVKHIYDIELKKMNAFVLPLINYYSNLDYHVNDESWNYKINKYCKTDEIIVDYYNDKKQLKLKNYYIYVGSHYWNQICLFKNPDKGNGRNIQIDDIKQIYYKFNDIEMYIKPKTFSRVNYNCDLEHYTYPALIRWYEKELQSYGLRFEKDEEVERFIRIMTRMWDKYLG